MTAAHCVVEVKSNFAQKDKTLENLLIVAGKFYKDLDDTRDADNIQNRTVSIIDV